MDERRQLGEERASVEVAVASSVGVVAVRVGGDRVGEFSLEHRCTARDVAVAEHRLAVATPDDVLLGDDADPSGFGPASVVGADGAAVVAVGPDGTVGRHDDGWRDCGRAGSDVRAADGGLLATADGVYTVDDLTPLGLDDARDVAADEWAATGDGLYRRADDGWERERAGDFVAVTAGENRVLAATGDAVLSRRDGWAVHESPVADPLADVATDLGTYAVTEGGTFLVESADGWRSRALGVPDVRRLAVRGPERKRI